MPKILKDIMQVVGLGRAESGGREISRQGAVRVDSSELVRTEEVKQQIDTLGRLIKDGRVKIGSPDKA